MADYKDLGLDDFMNADIGLAQQKSETDVLAEWQDRSISMNKLTVGVLTGGTVQTDSKDNTGIKIIGKTGIDVYGVTIRFLDTDGVIGGMITGIANGGVKVYSTTGDVVLDSGANQLRLTYVSMRWDDTPTAEEITAADYYVVVNMNGSDYKLMLKSI